MKDKMKNVAKKILDFLEVSTMPLLVLLIVVVIVALPGIVMFRTIVVHIEDMESSVGTVLEYLETMPKAEEQEEQVVQETIPVEEEEEESDAKEIAFTEIGTYSDFSLLYLKDTSEFVCSRDGEEIGSRTYVSPTELVGFLNYINSRDYLTGYLTGPDNDLIYPIFIKEANGKVSFHLYPIEHFAEEPSTLFAGYFYQARYGDIDYHIYNDRVYCLEEAEQFMLESETFGNEYGGKYIPIVDELISLKVVQLAEFALGKTHIFDSSDKITAFSTFNNHVLLYTSWPKSNLLARNMIQEGLFQENITDEMDSYVFDTWLDAKEVIDYIDASCSDSGETPESVETE